jgi:hypothetical protein
MKVRKTMPDLFTDLLYGIYLAIALSFIGGLLIGLGLRDWLRIARNEDDTVYVEPEEVDEEAIARRWLESCVVFVKHKK